MSQLCCQINCMNLSFFFFFFGHARLSCEHNGHNGAPKCGFGEPCCEGDLIIFKVSQLIKHVQMLVHERNFLSKRQASKLRASFVRNKICGQLRQNLRPLQRNYSTLFGTFDSSDPSRSSPPAFLLHLPLRRPTQPLPSRQLYAVQVLQNGALMLIKVSFVKHLHSLWRNLFELAPPCSFAPQNTKQVRGSEPVGGRELDK